MSKDSNKKLALFDANSLIMTGIHVPAFKKYNVDNFPTSGLYSLFRSVKNAYQEGFDILVCVDSKYNIRKEKYPEYKSKRKNNSGTVDGDIKSSILGSLDGLLELATIPYVKIEGYEADDLIYKAVSTADDYEYIRMYSDDSDLNDVILFSRLLSHFPYVEIERIAANRKDPDLNSDEYFKHPFSSSTIDKIVTGDTSDNYSSLRYRGSSRLMRDFADSFYQYLEQNAFEILLTGKISSVNNFINQFGGLTDYEKEVINRNLFLATNKNLEIDLPRHGGEIDGEKFFNVLVSLDMYTLYKDFKDFTTDYNYIQKIVTHINQFKTERMNEYFGGIQWHP